MRTNRIIEETIVEAKDRFENSLTEFYPAYGKNGFSERNLTFQFCTVFTSRPRSHAFMEIPLYNPGNERHDSHIDAYVFDNQIGIFIESKRLFGRRKAKSLLDDILRMNDKNVAYILEECHEKKLPKNIYALVLIESWREHINDWWMDPECNGTVWGGRFPNNMIRNCHEVKKWSEDDSTLYWLYGYRRIKS